MFLLKEQPNENEEGKPKWVADARQFMLPEDDNKFWLWVALVFFTLSGISKNQIEHWNQ